MRTLPAALSAVSLLSLAHGAKANPLLFPNGPAYGLVSIAASQTIRLHLFNSSADTAASCTVQSSLIDGSGRGSLDNRNEAARVIIAHIRLPAFEFWRDEIARAECEENEIRLLIEKQRLSLVQ